MGYVVICPGFQAPYLTDCFLQSLQTAMAETTIAETTIATAPIQWFVFPVDRYPPYAGWQVVQFLWARLQAQDRQKTLDQWLKQPIAFIGFSAGTIGAIAAAQAWQGLGGTVQVLIALDGWGVPLWGNFPIHRLSHDQFTHWSSALLGSGQDSFYADPGVEHLELWRSPHAVHGWWIASNPKSRSQTTTAVQFIAQRLGKDNRKETGVRMQESGVRSQESGIRKQESGVRN